MKSVLFILALCVLSVFLGTNGCDNEKKLEKDDIVLYYKQPNAYAYKYNGETGEGSNLSKAVGERMATMKPDHPLYSDYSPQAAANGTFTSHIASLMFLDYLNGKVLYKEMTGPSE